MAIDFAALAARLLSQSRSLLAEWYPHGKLHGHEFKIGDVYGGEGESCSINVETGKWSDFAAGTSGGDLISLYAAREGLSQAEAARSLEGDYTVTTRTPAAAPKEKVREKWTAVVPAPADAPDPTNDYYRKGPSDASGKDTWVKLKFVARWAYRSADGALLGYAVRFEWFDPDGTQHKDIVPQVYCESDGKRSWRWKAFPEPRPLYGLAELAARSDAPVIVVEGEKKVEALKLLAPQYVGVCWPGGAASWRKADWLPLAGRSVLCWPDADKQVVRTQKQADEFKLAIGALIPRDSQPGMRAMWEIGHYLLKQCPMVKVIVPDDAELPDGWDAADAVRDGWDWQRFKAWALPRVFNLTENGNGNAQQRSAWRHGANAGGHGGATAGDASAARDADRAPQSVAASAQASQADRADAASRGYRGDPGEQRGREDDRGPAPGLGRASGSKRDQRGGDRHARGGDTQTRSGGGPASALQQRDAVRAQEVSAQPQSQIGRWLAWGLERNGNGIPIVNLNNAVIVLESDPELRKLVWFDEFLGRLMTGEPAREWTDADDISLTLYMQRVVGISKLGRDTASQAVIAVAMRDRRNCAREFVEAQTWDRAPRIDTFLSTVFHCEDTAYARAASRNFWVSMVARVMQPGCKVDNMLVLEGAQGLFKSSALKAIADPWFAEQHEQATNPKAFAEILLGKLLTEIGEMDSFNRAEVTTIKKVVSCQVDRYRASYARHAADHPRQGIMVGTVNKDDWNRDETGARRFWPIRCVGEADIDYVRANRAQCFAEALVALRAGERWWVMPEAETVIEQRKRYDADPWITPISDYLIGRDSVTVNEIATGPLRIDMKDIDRSRQMRIAGCLRALQWSNSGNTKRAGKVIKLWIPGSDQFGEKRPESDESAKRSLPENELPFQ